MATKKAVTLACGKVVFSYSESPQPVVDFISRHIVNAKCSACAQRRKERLVAKKLVEAQPEIKKQSAPRKRQNAVKSAAK